MNYTSREVYEFISRQTNDPIVERKTCAVSGQPFAIFQSDLDFYSKISPTFAGQKFQIPTPTFCPEERQRRRLSFRNERKLYKRQCDASKKSIISIYSPDKPYKIYDQKIRRSDSRDPMNYSMDFDFSKTFTENFRNISLIVPFFSLYVTESENCEYANALVSSKNCYLCSGSRNNNCLYSQYINDCSDSIDNFMIFNSSLCYNCSDCTNCLNCIYSNRCKESSNLINCVDCIGCENCIGCSNLINKKYNINNIQYTKDEYEKNLIQNKNHIQLKNILQNLPQQNSLNSYGGNITGCKDSSFIFDCHNSINIKYCSRFNDSSDCMDNHSRGKNAQLCYENAGVGVNSYHNYSCFRCQNSMSIGYSYFCFDSSYLFGCIGLRNKSYCIFNKQYTKEDYETTIAKIITHMQTTGERGEFFHPSLSPFGYNETVAMEYFPIQNGNLQEFGYHRSNYNADPSLPEGVQTIERKNYSDEQRNSLLQEDNLETKVFLCSVSTRPYRLQKAEIEFYRKHHLLIPDKHPDVRHEERIKLRPVRTLFLRTCDCCSKEMLSVYQQNHEGKVYCEECYQKEIYS